jgi:short-subunit dehydrogenase
MALVDKYGPVAVITGAAQGIGAGFARALAAEGFDLLLCDIAGEKLSAFADQLQHESGRRVDVVVADLGEPEGPMKVAAAAEGSDVGLLICNHLRGTPSAWFLDGELEHHRAALEVNVRAYMDLAHLFGQTLRARGRGGIILMSSMTGVVGSPGVATYGASKAYILALGSALSYELGRAGIDVLTLVPSSVNTETYKASLHKQATGFAPMEVDQFVERALQALGRRPVCVPGARNAMTAQVLGRILPRRMALRVMGRSLEQIVGL